MFILVAVLSVCEFAMMPGMFILLCPQEEEVHSSSWGHRCTHLPEQSSKRFKPLTVTILLWDDIVELKKSTKKEFNCVYGACNLNK